MALQTMQVPEGLVHTPQDVLVDTKWLKNASDRNYQEPIYAVRDLLHNARMADAKFNALNVWVDLKEIKQEQGSPAAVRSAECSACAICSVHPRLQAAELPSPAQGGQAVFSVEDDGAGLSAQGLSNAMNLSPKASSEDSPCQISHFGEGMKVAAQGLTQADGFIMFFSIKDGNRTVVVLDTGAKGQAQYYLLWLPPALPSADYGPDGGLQANSVLCQLYRSLGLPHPQASIIDRICRSPAGTGISGNPKSPYDTVLDVLKVSGMLFLHCRQLLRA